MFQLRSINWLNESVRKLPVLFRHILQWAFAARWTGSFGIENYSSQDNINCAYVDVKCIVMNSTSLHLCACKAQKRSFYFSNVDNGNSQVSTSKNVDLFKYTADVPRGMTSRPKCISAEGTLNSAIFFRCLLRNDANVLQLCRHAIQIYRHLLLYQNECSPAPTPD